MHRSFLNQLTWCGVLKSLVCSEFPLLVVSSERFHSIIIFQVCGFYNHSVLSIEVSCHLECLLSTCLGTSEAAMVSGGYLVITTLWCPLRHSNSSYSFLWVLTLGLEPKVPDCARF